MEIPDELVALTRLRLDDEVKQIGPPDEILNEIEAVLNGGEPSDVLTTWMEAQRSLQMRAAEQIQRLWDNSPDLRDGLPGWITHDWAYTLHLPWSQHLSGAVELAEQWK